MRAVCQAGGHEYQRRRGDTGYACEQCLANAHARAERTVEQRQQPKVKADKPRQSVGLAPEDVCR